MVERNSYTGLIPGAGYNPHPPSNYNNHENGHNQGHGQPIPHDGPLPSPVPQPKPVIEAAQPAQRQTLINRLPTNTLGEPAGNGEGQIVLTGTLDSFSPSSLLSLLNIQKLTGRLLMKSETENGAVFVEKGEVFDASLEDTSGAVALFQLFGWKVGTFIFEANVPLPPKRTIQASLPVLQVRATLWLDNWNKYNPMIPSTLHRIGIAREPRSEVMIEPYHWAVLTRIVAQPMSINQLANELGQNVMNVTKTAADLVKMGVAVVFPPEGSEHAE